MRFGSKREGVRVVGDDVAARPEEIEGQAHEARDEATERILRQVAAAMRRSDEDHPSDERLGLEKEALTQEFPRLGLHPQLIQRLAC